MKKLILAMAVVAFSVANVQAQDGAKSTTLSLGVNVGIPTTSGYSVAYGADLQADFAVAPTTKITASAGYENYKLKNLDINTYIIPVLAGAKFNLGSDKLYGHAQLGAGFGKNSYTAFAYAPSIGYYFSPNLDGSIKYLAFSKNSTTIGSVNLRLAYNF